MPFCVEDNLLISERLFLMLLLCSVTIHTLYYQIIVRVTMLEKNGFCSICHKTTYTNYFYQSKRNTTINFYGN